MSGWIEQFIENHGTVAIVAGTALEGEAVAITGGVLAHRALMPFWEVVLAAAAGGYLWGMAVFVAARTWRDTPRVRRMIQADHVAGLVARLSRNMVLFALLFRFIPGLRTVGPVSLAGLGMAPLVYALVSGVSALAWGVTGVTLGYVMGHGIEQLFGPLHRVEHALIGPAILAVLILGGVMWWRHRR